MRGKWTMKVNQETVRLAVQKYLDDCVFVLDSPQVVQSVHEIGEYDENRDKLFEIEMHRDTELTPAEKAGADLKG